MENIDFKPKKILYYFKNISVYRKLLNDDVIKTLYDLIEKMSDKDQLINIIDCYNSFFYKLNNSDVSALGNYFIDLILYDENSFSLAAGSGKKGIDSLKKAAGFDIDKFQDISSISSSNIKKYLLKNVEYRDFEKEMIENLAEWKQYDESLCSRFGSLADDFIKSEKWSDCMDELIEFYKNNGCGIYAEYNAFVWNNNFGVKGLKGVKHPDSVRLSDLIGYDIEREKVIDNTIQFINGYPANNVLLYGDRGTGKSSTVKALLNEYCEKGLRIIELPKKYIPDFPEIINCVTGRSQKFIVFIDDLTFADNEENYTALKAVLEGGLETRPNNVLIYATSNRRHLVSEKMSDRSGLTSDNYDEEVHSEDIIQEKLSLADRFGITAVFTAPDKKKYLKIVDSIAEKRGIKMEKEMLHAKAVKWEMTYNGRSPRTARQFIDWLEGNNAVNSINDDIQSLESADMD